eukprot:350381-Chlamydomonas_euryale.AAC.4
MVVGGPQGDKMEGRAAWSGGGPQNQADPGMVVAAAPSPGGGPYDAAAFLASRKPIASAAAT